MQPLISICIPTYKNTVFLKRLLDSVSIQTHKNFEVIISDDSPGNEVADNLAAITSLKVRYFKNSPALGPSANWNFAMQQANGEFIKLMHDDDWFATPDALQLMVETLQQNVHADFVFSGYNNVYDDGKIKTVLLSSDDEKRLKQHPLHLFRNNYIGHPSVILQRKKGQLFYDESIKWVVDFEAYMRWIKQGHQFAYIDKPLINIGLGTEQVTFSSFRNKAVELPENFYLLNKLGIAVLKDIWVYDYYWRLLRNLNIKNTSEITEYVEYEIPLAIIKMLQLQKQVTHKFLLNGAVSKCLMACSYIATQKLVK